MWCSTVVSQKGGKLRMALAATGVAGSPDWTALPADAWLNILRRVPGRGVVSCRCTCRRLEQLTRDEPLWQQQCHALAVQQLGSVVNGPNFSSTGAQQQLLTQ